MLPKWHILIGFVISYVLIYFFNFSLFAGIVIFISSWLVIDLDHYFYYIYKKKDWNFFRFYYQSIQDSISYKSLPKEKREKFPKRIFIFHGIECWIILSLLSFFHPLFIWILIGFAIHIIIDWIEIYYIKEPIHIKLSQIYTYIKNKKKI